MLVLSRKPEESVIVAGEIRITVLAIRGHQVRLGIEAPDAVKILRSELVGSPGVAPEARPVVRAAAVVERSSPPLQAAMHRTGHTSGVVAS